MFQELNRPLDFDLRILPTGGGDGQAASVVVLFEHAEQCGIVRRSLAQCAARVDVFVTDP